MTLDELRYQAAVDAVRELPLTASTDARVHIAISTYLSASSPPVGGSGEVVVKPLEWFAIEYSGGLPSKWQAASVVGVYYARSHSWWRESTNDHWVDGEIHSTIENVQAAAQADYETRVRSALFAPVPNGVPEGFKLVPIEPTEAMIEAAEKAWEDKPLSGWGKSVDLTPKETYCAMLAASPVTPEGLSGGTDLICYESRTPQDGVIRLQFYGDHYVLWYHGEIVWKSTP